MLDFLSDLKMCPDSSFEIEKDQENLMEDFLESQEVKPFPAEDNREEQQENLFLEEVTQQHFRQGKEKTSKKRRGNKKDDFDYNKYIDRELKKMDTSKMDSSRKKKLIQKIRNRMSAQRSRLR